MSDKWQKIISIVRKTGDRCIIFDPQSEEAFVVMELGEYGATHLPPRAEPAIQGGRSTNLTQKSAPDNIEPNSIPLPEEPGGDQSLDDLNSFSQWSEESEPSSHSFYLEPIE